MSTTAEANDQVVQFVRRLIKDADSRLEFIAQLVYKFPLTAQTAEVIDAVSRLRINLLHSVRLIREESGTDPLNRGRKPR